MLVVALGLVSIAGCQDVLGIDVVVGRPGIDPGPDASPGQDSGPVPTACETTPDVCGPDGTCRAQDAGYLCECAPGYEFDATTCSDIDECDRGLANCDPNAICSNGEGTFTCTCAGGYVGDGATCALPSTCQDLNLAGQGDGSYLIDPDDSGPLLSYGVYCKNSIAGGGWQLISSRLADNGALFAPLPCRDPADDCSGTIPPAQIHPGVAPDILFATSDDQTWLRMTGVAPPGAGALLDVITLQRALVDNDLCTDPHYCNVRLDPGLRVAETSPGYTPRFTDLIAQFSRFGGLWFGNGGGGGNHHVVSLNYVTYCPAGGIDFSGPMDDTLGNVVCGQPGAIYFRY